MAGVLRSPPRRKRHGKSFSKWRSVLAHFVGHTVPQKFRLTFFSIRSQFAQSSVVLGLITTKKPALESKDGLKRRIDEAARYVPLDQLCLSPQCGFASTAEGNLLTLDEQIAKLRLVVEVAREVWG